MRTTVFFLIALLAAPVALAQPGPAPGHASAIDYAGAYAQERAGDAVADPANTTLDPQVEVPHTLYMACWAADDAGVEHEVCDPYYTPRGQEAPDQPACDCNASEAPEDAAAYAQESANATAAYAGNATAFLNATVEDPQNATAHAEGFFAATAHFAKGVVFGARDLVVGIADGILLCLGVTADVGTGAGRLAIDGVRASARALETGFRTAVDGLGLAATSSGDALASGLKGLGEGVLAAVGAVGDAVVASAKGFGHGAMVAARAVGDAAVAVRDAVVDGLRAVKDTVVDLFDGKDAAPDLLDGPDGLGVDPDADGLLDGVTGLLE